jgi:DtxR family Mn-dependent transcriptional regulator
LFDRDLSRSVQDYLKTIYGLQQDGGAVHTSQLAERMGVTQPSATNMVGRLSEAGLIRHQPYKGVELTERGASVALEVIRHHRLWEAFLHQALGVPIDQLHDEAERLEHELSDDLEAQIARALGHPTHDPHGDPIPAPDGTIDAAVHPVLTDLPVGAAGVVRRVPGDDPALLRYLDSLGLLPGAEVRIKRREPFRGPLTLAVGADDRVIGHELASRLLVEPGAGG